MNFKQLPKLQKGDKVAILSPSFAAPGMWPHVFELGLKRLREVFELEPVLYPTTSKLGASKEERSADLIAAFENPEIKAIITSIGGNDQVTYVKNLPMQPFANNPKPFFGFSDNTHLVNHLWQCGVPSYYGGAIFTQFAMQVEMDEFTVKYLRQALFGEGDSVGEVGSISRGEASMLKVEASDKFNDEGLDWNDPATLDVRRKYEPSEGWIWETADAGANTQASGVSWGGCLESIDEMLRHGIRLPNLTDFEDIVLVLETSEEMPEAGYVMRVLRALGERGILAAVRGLLVGRPQAWNFDKPLTAAEKQAYKTEQRDTIVREFRKYNQQAPIVQNLDIGHTNPQICLPMGKQISIDSVAKTISAEF